MVEHEAREVEKEGAVVLKEMSKKRDGSARELREMATSTRQLVMVREKKAAAPTWRSLLGWTLAAGEFRHPHYLSLRRRKRWCTRDPTKVK